MAVRRNTVLDTRYSFEYDVGQWTYGTVHVLKERETGQMKTCKAVTKATLQLDSGIRPRLEALKNLQHPHICSVTDVLEDRDSFYIISEHFQGGDVQDWMDRLEDTNWLQEGTCAAYIRQAILAIAHSHAVQVYHDDLRPSSLLLSSKMPDACVKVCDFGLASILDPDQTVLRQQATQYTVPEILRGGLAHTGVGDIWSVGAIAQVLLTGRAPRAEAVPLEPSAWSFGRTVNAPEDDIWGERSDMAHDFVRRCLRQHGEDRPTAAKLLWHPWLKGMSPLTTQMLRGDEDIAREVRHKTLCYTLAVLLLPAVVPFKDFEDLRTGFQHSDPDCDGLISRAAAQRLLLSRTNHLDAVLPALGIVDVSKTDVLDLCGTACADLIVREFFASGPTHAPLVGPFRATDLASRMLAMFFSKFGGRGGQGGSGTCTACSVHTKIRTPTQKVIEEHTQVDYDLLLSCLPEGCSIDSQLLTTQLCKNAGQGTPLGTDGDLSPLGPGPSSSLDFFSFGGFFKSCGMGAAKRDDSPFSLRVSH